MESLNGLAFLPQPSGRLFSTSSSRTGRNSCQRYSPHATAVPIPTLMSTNRRYAGSQIAVAATIAAATARAAVPRMGIAIPVSKEIPVSGQS